MVNMGLLFLPSEVSRVFISIRASGSLLALLQESDSLTQFDPVLLSSTFLNSFSQLYSVYKQTYLSILV